MGTSSGIGIGIGIGVVIGFGFAFAFLAGMNQDTPILENIPTLVDAEPKFARLEASYDYFDDKTTVVLILTDNDGKFVKANGAVKLTLCNEVSSTDRLIDCFSNDFTFEKDDFYTWQDNSGRKFTGHRFVIYQELSNTQEVYGWWWQASADIVIDELTWYDVDVRFDAFGE